MTGAEIGLLAGLIIWSAVTRGWMKCRIADAKIEGESEGFDRGCSMMVKDMMATALAAGADPNLMLEFNQKKIAAKVAELEVAVTGVKEER